MTVPNYIKMTALGVKIQQVKEVYVPLTDEDRAILKDVLERYCENPSPKKEAIYDVVARILGEPSALLAEPSKLENQ